MNSGNRIFAIGALSFFCAFVATDAGRVGEDGTGAMWVAPELLDALGQRGFPDCKHEVVIEAADLQTNGRVVFEWHPATGELTFATNKERPELTLPAEVAPEPVSSPIQSCESR